MLPILRFLPVGCVLLAILILVLALTPPDGSRGPLSSPGVPARGVLSDRDRQAETRQFLIHAALKRADQLSRLRDLPATRAHSEEPKTELAGLPAERSDADPEESSSINEPPANTIPIGVPSIEVPIPSPQDTPLTLKPPEQSKAQQETRRRAQRPRRTSVSGTQPRPLNFFEIMFGNSRRRSASRRGRSLTPIRCSVRNRRSSINIPRTVISNISNRPRAAGRPVISNISNRRTPASRQAISSSSNNRPTAISRPVSSGNNHSLATQTNRRVSPPALASARLLKNSSSRAPHGRRTLVRVGPRIGIRPGRHAAIVECTQLLIRAELDVARSPK